MNIEQIQTQLKTATNPQEIDFLENLLIEQTFEAKELGQIHLEQLNIFTGGRRHA